MIIIHILIVVNNTARQSLHRQIFKQVSEDSCEHWPDSCGVQDDMHLTRKYTSNVKNSMMLDSKDKWKDI